MSEWNYLERIYAEVAPWVHLHKPPRSAHSLESPVLGTSSERGDCPWPVGFQPARAYGAESHNGDPRGVNLRQHWAHTWYWLLLPEISHCLGFFWVEIAGYVKLNIPFLQPISSWIHSILSQKSQGVTCTQVLIVHILMGWEGVSDFMVIAATKPVETRKTARWWHDHVFVFFF